MRRPSLFLIVLFGAAMTVTGCEKSQAGGSDEAAPAELTTSAQALVARGPRGKRGPRGPRGFRGRRGPAGPPGSAGAPVHPVVPGLAAVTINRSYFQTGKDGGSAFVMLRLFDDAASTGTFYGDGYGNKSMLGATGYDREPLADFEALSFRAKVPASSPRNRGVYANFIVDLACDDLDPRYAIIVVDRTLGVGAQGDWHEYAFGADDPVFRAVGGRGGLPGHLDAAAGTLDVVTGGHPDACFVNADPFDNGMPKHTKLPSILLVLGDSLTTSASHIYLDDFSVMMSGVRTTWPLD